MKGGESRSQKGAPMANRPPPTTIGADVALTAAARQLDAAIAEQERAVTRILGLVELLIDHAPDPVSRQRLEGILEACGFQDVTGQRIQRVGRLLRHIARHAPVPIPPPPVGNGAGATQDVAKGQGLTQEQVDKLLKGGRL